jgi:hypothetical protein
MLSGMVVGMGGYGSGVAQPDPNLSKRSKGVRSKGVKSTFDP